MIIIIIIAAFVTVGLAFNITVSAPSLAPSQIHPSLASSIFGESCIKLQTNRTYAIDTWIKAFQIKDFCI